MPPRAATRPAHIAATTGIPEPAVTRILRRHHQPRLCEYDPLTGPAPAGAPPPATNTTTPGALMHLDVKKIDRIPDDGGRRAHDRATTAAQRHKKNPVGYDHVHTTVDDHSRLTYTEILGPPRGKGTTRAGFLLRAAAFFRTACPASNP